MNQVYNLYLDESETHTNGNNRVFCIAGIIVEKSFHDTVIKSKLDSIKKSIWGQSACSNPQYILHEKDIRYVQNRANRYNLNQVNPINLIFNSTRPNTLLFKGLKEIINIPQVTVIGGCIVEDELRQNYDRNLLPEKKLIIMQVIVENFCHFLSKKNAMGHIYYEWIEEKENNIMRRRFNHVEMMGTMYINADSVQKHIVNIHFPKKNENVAGLQIADFLPNDIVRKAAGKPKHHFNLTNEIRLARYDGAIGRFDKFGIKIIPRK